MNIWDAMEVLDKSDVCHWQVEVTPINALKFAVVADNDLFDFFNDINEIMPKPDYGEDNPNSGKYVHTFYIGQECSRVVYISLIPTYIPSGQVNYIELEKQIREIAQKYHADEVDNTGERLAFKMRIWWD